ncbi:MAG: universal stress protein [Nitrospirae bacterium]|nr:universal stress protein [Nitrospirota bacterium]NTW65346.1 universal stress protein [Nitrospirota bacterium]
MNILVASDGSPDSQSALTYGIGKALETRGKLTVVHVYQRRKRGSEQALQDSLQCFDSVRASIQDHGCGVPANAVFMTITDHHDILTYAANAQIDLIVAPPAFDALFCSACCLVDIVSAEDLQTAIQ